MVSQTNSRTKNSIFNILAQSATSVGSMIVSFLNRIIFLHYLNATYLGVSGLFSNILLILSLVELGLGGALTQMFYKPFADKDYKYLSKVTYTTRILLNIVGIVVLILTAIFTPLLQFFVNDMNAVPNMRLIFLLYGMSSSVTYFLGYYRIIITANQQAYKLVKIDLIWKIVTLVGQSIALAVTRNFIIYLITQIVLSFMLNVVIRYYVRKEIPEIDYHCKEFVSKNARNSLLKNVTGLSLNRIATVVTNGTDNILISKFMDLVTVGFASNYVMIQQSVNTLVEALFGPLLSSIGNLCVNGTDEDKYNLFNNLTFAAFWLYGFCSLTAFILADPFIEFLFGEEYLIQEIATLFLCLYIFVCGLYRVAYLFRTAQGLFWYGKFRPLIQSAINLTVSLILVVITHELWAVYAGTVISIISITVWYEPYIVLKYGMKKKPWKHYKCLIEYMFAYLVTGFIIYMISKYLILSPFLKLLTMAFICLLLINGIFSVFFIKTKEFEYWSNFVKKILKRRIN